VRQVTKSVNPKGKATWPLANLYDRECEYAYQVYDQIDHPALGESPRNAFLKGIASTGFRSHRLIPYDEDFLMSTRPTTPKGTAKLLPGRGVKIHHLYYWSESFRDPDIENKQLKVRYDPFDIGTAYALVKNRWVRCHSEYYAVFNGRSEKELLIATKELRGQKTHHSRQFTVSAKRLADFLQSVAAEESLLMQRLRDSEGRHVLNAINGEVAPPVNMPASLSSEAEDLVDESPTEADSEDLEVYEDF
jgi:hypothetical protein